MTDIKIPALCLIFLLTGIIEVAAQKNYALQKTCTIDPQTNYSYTVGKNSPTDLTDGVLASKNPIWIDPATLGWSQASLITIKLDLGDTVDIGEITLNTASNINADALLPLNILVFTSSNDSDYLFAGDMMKGIVQKPGYNIIKLSLKNTGPKAQYIQFKIVPRGYYFFTDEVEVFAPGKDGKITFPKSSSEKKIIHKRDINVFVERTVTQKKNRIFLDEYITATRELPGTTKLDSLARIEKELDEQGDLDDSLYSKYRKNIVSLGTQSSGSAGLEIKKYDPFADKISLLNTPGANNLQTDTSITVCVGCVSYAGFAVYNKGSREEKINLSSLKVDPVSTVEIYNQELVKTRDFKIIPDALIPATKDSLIDISPGETKFFMIKFTGKRKGTSNKLIRLKWRNSSRDWRYKVQVNTTAINKSSLSLNANAWAYYTYPLLVNMEAAARKDLLSHHINTMVIPPSVLTIEDPQKTKKNLKGYLAHCAGFEKILLYVNLTGKTKTKDFFSDAWKSSFLTWYDTSISVLHSNHFTQNYLYLFDEIAPGDVPVFLEIIDWLKQERPEVKFYCTVNNERSLKALSPVLDAIQVFNNNNLIDKAASITNKWMYDYRQPLKSQSPYRYFRLMAWKAYSLGFTGIGFWNYADVGPGKGSSSWDDLDGTGADNSVIYKLDGQIISSRRWEAFRLGIEDYELLLKHQKKYGPLATLKLCNSVLDQQNDPTAADRIRMKIFKLLN